MSQESSDHGQSNMCPSCATPVRDPNLAFCVQCGRNLGPEVARVDSGLVLERHPSMLGRLKLPIAGGVVILISALVLFVPVFNLGGRTFSVMQGRDICSNPFGAVVGDCSTINILFFVALFLVAAGLVLIAVGLIRHGGMPAAYGDQPARPVATSLLQAQPDLQTSMTAESRAGWPSAASPLVAPPSVAAALRAVGAPITWPKTSIGWMIGAGSAVGAMSFVLPWTSGYGYFATWGLARPLNIVLMLALVGVAATVFLPDRIPDVAVKRLGVLIVTLVGLGVGFDQLGGLSVVGSLLFFLGTLSAASGSVMLELPATAAKPAPAAAPATVTQDRMAALADFPA